MNADAVARDENTPRVMVMGGSGLLGHKLCQVLAERCDVCATFRGKPPDVLAARLTGGRAIHPVRVDTMEGVAEALDRVRPDVVVNAIGVVKRASGDEDPVTCLRVNALFPHLLAGLCAARGARLVHIGTDCVFAGRTGRYREEDPPDAQDLYGQSKRWGEVAGRGCLTLRTSMIGREIGTSRGLVEWFLSNRGGTVRGFRHAVFSGLTTLELSRAIECAIRARPPMEGLFHVAAEPIDKHALLTLLRDAYAADIRIVPDEAVRCDRSLNGERFRMATGYVAPAWPDMIAEMARDPFDRAPELQRT